MQAQRLIDHAVQVVDMRNFLAQDVSRSISHERRNQLSDLFNLLWVRAELIYDTGQGRCRGVTEEVVSLSFWKQGLGISVHTLQQP
jgi:hypothetical protein